MSSPSPFDSVSTGHQCRGCESGIIIAVRKHVLDPIPASQEEQNISYHCSECGLLYKHPPFEPHFQPEFPKGNQLEFAF